MVASNIPPRLTPIVPGKLTYQGEVVAEFDLGDPRGPPAFIFTVADQRIAVMPGNPVTVVFEKAGQPVGFWTSCTKENL